MYKDINGKWVNGSAARAKYHVQARSNSKMMEMTSYYLNRFCGDGTPPKVTEMTVLAKIDKETGRQEPPQKIQVKKYSFTYAMAFERLSQGKGLVSPYDKETLTKLDELIGLVRKIPPMATEVDTAEIINCWLEILRQAYEFVDNGQKPFYLTDILGCWPEQLQIAMEQIYEDKPDQDWRIRFCRIVSVLQQKMRVEDAYLFPFKENKEKDNYRDFWREGVRMKMDSRYNIRTDTRFPADKFSSDTVRGWLEWIFYVPSGSGNGEYRSILHDIETVRDFIKDARCCPRTKRAKEEIRMKLRSMLSGVKTNSEAFIIWRSKDVKQQSYDREQLCKEVVRRKIEEEIKHADRTDREVFYMNIYRKAIDYWLRET